MTPETITLAILLTPGGGLVAAAIVRQLVEVIKGVFPAIDARFSGALQAFVLSAALFVVAFLSVGDKTLEGGFGAFLAWLACATAAVGIDAGLTHVAQATKTTQAYIPRSDGQL